MTCIAAGVEQWKKAAKELVIVGESNSEVEVDMATKVHCNTVSFQTVFFIFLQSHKSYQRILQNPQDVKLSKA